MREIKFRGKGIKTKDWVYGTYVPAMDDDSCDSIIDANGVWHLVYGATIGQFTGLTDKNGNEIYEGDIVRYDPGVCDEKIVAEVRYCVEDGRLFIVNDEDYISEDFCDESAQNSVIAGNIHDSHELLKN